MNNRNCNNRSKNQKPNLPFSIFSVLFMLYWNYSAFKSGQWNFTVLLVGGFGLFMTALLLVNTIKQIRNEKRDSEFGEMPPGNEPEVWDKDFDDRMRDCRKNDVNSFGNTNDAYIQNGERNFCPYCGVRAENDYKFCKTCGRQFPQ